MNDITSCIGVRSEYVVVYNDMKVIFKVREAGKVEMGQKIHHDGFKPLHYLEWWSAVASVR